MAKHKTSKALRAAAPVSPGAADAAARIAELVQTGRPAAIWVPPDVLHEWADNPRENDHAVSALDASLARWGWGDVIVALLDGEIISGNTRWKAAIARGEKEVPVRFVDMKREDAHDFAIALNRLGELARWDQKKLAMRIADRLAANGAAVRAMGFKPEDIERMLKNRAKSPVVQRVATEDVEDEFWMNVKGPLEGQREVLEQLRTKLGKVAGVTVQVGTVAKGA